MNAPRGPRNDLWVVLVTTWACGAGDGVDARGDEPGDVRHVDHEDGSHLVGDLAEAFEVDSA